MTATSLPLVLASASPRRRQLLAEAGFDFHVLPADVEEPDPAGFADARAYVAHTAWLKADAVRVRLPRELEGRWVLAADTVAAHDGHVLGKPTDRDDARRILRTLAGTTHVTLTGVCLASPRHGFAVVDVIATQVTMKPLSTDELEAYLDSGAWQGKAGAYGIQDQPEHDPFVAALDGSVTNVIGLPMERLAELLACVLGLAT